MKKVIIQFGQWILKHKKRLIYGALAFFIGQICFLNIGGIGIQNEVFADASSDKESTTQKASFDKVVSERLSLMDFFKKTVYIIVYPMMFLAGKLVDNSLVYGEMFKFDIVLWNLWNMIRNLANYGLGFIFIYYIFWYIITKDKNKNPKWIIIRSLIAGVGIQASWFLMAVLIDISTIMIYGIGGLPLSILGGSGGSGEDTDSYVMKTIISVDANDISNTHFYLTNIPTEGGTQIYISECETFAIRDSSGIKGSEEYILGPKMHYYQNQEGEIFPTQQDLCDYYGSVYKFKRLNDQLLQENNEINVGSERGSKNKYEKVQSAYDENKSIVKGYIKNNASHILNRVYDGTLLEPGNKIGDIGDFGWDEDNEYTNETYKTQKMSELMKSQDTKTYVGAFTSLYSSLLEAGRGMIPDTDGSPYIKFLSCLVTFGHALAIAIPLAAAVLVLIMRIAIIWMAIVLSPMIVLLSAFDFLGGNGNKDGVWGYFNLKSLIGIIFSPVVICFAVSMSTVLVRLINKMNFEDVVFQNNFKVLGIIEMNLGGFSVGLSRLIVGVMGVAISWFLVWMAVQSSKLGKSSIITGIKDLATSSLGAVPIVPVIGKDGTQQLASVNSVKKVVSDKYQEVKREFGNGDTKAVAELFNRSDEAAKAGERRKELAESSNKIQNFVDGLKTATITKDWMNGIDVTVDGKTEKMVFNNFDGAQKEKIMDKINSLSKDVLKKIGDATPDILFKVDGKDIKYTFTGDGFTKQQ